MLGHEAGRASALERRETVEAHRWEEATSAEELVVDGSGEKTAGVWSSCATYTCTEVTTALVRSAIAAENGAALLELGGRGDG
jgi:hypothetical protein